MGHSGGGRIGIGLVDDGVVRERLALDVGELRLVRVDFRRFVDVGTATFVLVALLAHVAPMRDRNPFQGLCRAGR
jgi:hypothetical protein